MTTPKELYDLEQDLERRGYNIRAYVRARARGVEDAITLFHPANWMSEAEAELPYAVDRLGHLYLKD